MSGTLAFDSLAEAKKLREAGFSEEQAEAQVMLITHLVDDQLATKRDLKELEQLTVAKIAEASRDTIKWVAGLLIGQAALIVALIKLL